MLRAKVILSAAWLCGALLWLVLAGHRSGAPIVLDRWSRSLGAVVIASGVALVVCLALVATLWLVPRRWEPKLIGALQVIRRRAWFMAPLALAPLIAWVLALAFLANVELPFMGRAWAGFAALSGLLLAWLALLFLADAPAPARRTLTGRFALLAISTAAAVFVVEAAGRALLGGNASGNLNPPGLDVSFETDEFTTRVVINRQGLREPAAIGAKPPGEIRVAFIGDSVTFGWGVEADETFAVQAEKLWYDRSPDRFVRSINAGKPGASLPDYLRVLRDDAPQWQADWVVLGFLIGNDCPVTPPVSLADDEAVQEAIERFRRQGASEPRIDLQKSMVLRAIHRATQRTIQALESRTTAGKRGPLFGEANPLDGELLEAQIASSEEKRAFEQRFHELTRQGWILRGRNWDVNPWLIRAAALDPAGVVQALGEDASTIDRLRHEWKLCEALLDDAIAIAERQGTKLCILAIPSPYQVSAECRRFLQQVGCAAPDSLAEATTINRWLAEYGARKGIVVVDPLEDFLGAADPDSLYYPADGHPTAMGHRLLAERLVEQMPIADEERGEE